MSEPNQLGKSQAQRIQEVGLGRWLDEAMDLDEFYGKPGPSLINQLGAWFKTKFAKEMA